MQQAGWLGKTVMFAPPPPKSPCCQIRRSGPAHPSRREAQGPRQKWTGGDQSLGTKARAGPGTPVSCQGRRRRGAPFTAQRGHPRGSRLARSISPLPLRLPRSPTSAQPSRLPNRVPPKLRQAESSLEVGGSRRQRQRQRGLTSTHRAQPGPPRERVRQKKAAAPGLSACGAAQPLARPRGQPLAGPAPGIGPGER